MAAAADGKTVYIANAIGGISVISTATNTVTASITTGGEPLGLALSPDGSTLYVPDFTGNKLATNTVTRTIPVGSGPFAVAVANVPVPLTATTTALTSSPNPSTAGAPVTYTATVSPVPDGGTVAFKDGSAAISGCGAVAVSGADGVKLLYDPAKKHNSGSAIPVKVQLVNAAGANLSTAGTTLTVTGLPPSPAPGKAPTGTFTFMTFQDQGPGYQLNIKTTGYPKGTYTLSFAASGDPTTHTITFIIG